MKFEFDFSYLKCQSCTAKIHCDDCCAELEERLGKMRGIDGVSIDIQNKHLAIQTGTLDEDDLLDMLEEVSVFAD